MHWKKLTGTDGKPLYVNLDKVTHMTAEIQDSYVPSQGITGRTWIEFVDRGEGISTIIARETPEQILKGLLAT